MKYYVVALIGCFAHLQAMENNQKEHEEICLWNITVAHYGEFESDIAHDFPLDDMDSYLQKYGWNKRLGHYLIEQARNANNQKAQTILLEYDKNQQANETVIESIEPKNL